MTPDPFPPWGQLDESFLGEIARNPIPADWTPPGGAPRDLQAWNTWLNGVIDVISAKLWPVHVPRTLVWNTPEIEALFKADFALMGRLHLMLREPIKVAHPTAVSHLELFVEEDDGNNPFGKTYERYDPLLSSADRNALRAAMGAGLRKKSGNVDLQMKIRFQRPRPWQLAVTQDIRDFSYRRALSASTPSLISGHCLQGCIAGCTAFATLGSQMTPQSLDILQQFTVDIGDRRVFAGVHYPSDNLSSWYTALRLIPTVFEPGIAPAVRDFLTSAITKHSVVFDAIRASACEATGTSPYAAILASIEEAST